MLWIKLDADHPEHPKIAPLSDAAYRLYIGGLCYSARFLTDGWVPLIIVGRNGRRPARELLDAGLWVEAPDGTGFLIHDYLIYQRSRSEVEAIRKRRSEAGSRNARKRWDADAE